MKKYAVSMESLLGERYAASASDFPGIVVRGKSRQAVLEEVRRLIKTHLVSAGAPAEEVGLVELAIIYHG